MIRKKEKSREVVIDLTGPEGNVFVLMGYAKRFSRELKDIYEEEMAANREMNYVLRHMDIEDILLPERLADKVISEMMESDYENAVQVFDKYFGSFVVLER